MSDDRPTYIYGLIDPRNGQIRYVGKTILDPKRRVTNHIYRADKERHKRHSMAWIRSLVNSAMRPGVVILEEVAAIEDWIDAEQFWIAYFRFLGADLCNHTVGGEGQTGYKQLPETVAKRIKRGAANPNFGKPMPEATKAALREGQLRLLADPERRAAANAKRRAAMTP